MFIKKHRKFKSAINGSKKIHFKSGVGKLRPAGQMRPSKKAHEHVFFLNRMRPAKENFAAREHVNVAR